MSESTCGAKTNKPDIACRCTKASEHRERSHHCRCGATWTKDKS